MIEFLETYKMLFLFLHIVGTALALGAVSIGDFLFLNNVKKVKKSGEGRIAQEQVNFLDLMSKFIWAGLIILFISGLALYLPKAEIYNQAPKFLAKVIAVLVLTINGIVLNLVVSPHLGKIDFNQPGHEISKKLKRIKRLAFIGGPISMVSWYFATLMGVTPRDFPLSFSQFVLAYVSFILIGILVSIIVEKTLEKKSEKS